MKRPPSDRQYAFVNATTPDRNRDEDVRKLVRTHVMIERCRDKKRKIPPKKSTTSLALSSTPLPTQALCSSQHGKLFSNTANSTSPTDCLIHVGYSPLSDSGLSSYPIEMNPRTHALLRFYMSDVTRRLYPLERHLTMNPLRTAEWFQFASSDDAIIRGMLYASSLLIALLQGKHESQEMSYYMNRTIQIVNRRLKDGGPLQDSTIIAVSCLALGEATVGNSDSWHTHMRGLKEMIRSRGSISDFPVIIQTKLRRTDISGAIDCAAKPYLDFQRTGKPTWTSLPRTTLGATRKCIDKLLTACGVSSELVNTMSELAFFTQTINLAKSGSIPGLDPVPFSEDTYWIQYKLLSFQSNSEDSIQERESDIHRACRLGALLYMKAILDELPNSTSGLWLGSPILLNQFYDVLCQIVVQESNKPLMIWLCLIGGCLSKSGMIREWLISQLEELVKGSAIESFRDKDVALSEVLPLEESFGKYLQQLWVEVFMR